MRVIGEIEAGRGVGRISTGIDPERPDLPVARNRAHHEENQDQRADEQEESEPAAAATVVVPSLGRGEIGRAFRASRCLPVGGLADCRSYQDGFRDAFRRGLCGGLGNWFGDEFRGLGRNGGTRLGWDGAARQFREPLVQLRLIGRRSILGLDGTPGS
jgi:hypothetical protein